MPNINKDHLSHCEPIYKKFEGWKETTSGATSIDQLPEQAKQFISSIESLLSTKVALVSTGPDRKDIIVLEKFFN